MLPRAFSALLLATVASATGAPDFNREVRPILFNNCVACHGPDDENREAKLRLDQHGFAVEARAIVPGKKEESEMWIRINDAEDPMPPEKTGHQLSSKEIETLGHWIDSGAAYDQHWSFKRPSRAALPKISKPGWPSNPIDHFILARLDAAELEPSPQSDPYTLIRRLSLDLTGLPPSPEQADAFARDPDPAAYEKLVDQLLASPGYGERWARMWLDLARYADSRGYGSDPLRRIWRYRDWVIDAFNRNLPYDQFTVEQLAGDLLPEATTDQLLATAFHRNTLTNTLGGTIDEEFRVVAVKDRTNTTGQVWMGLTVGCAQCHTHKFDPITQTEYYQLFAIFNQTEDNDRPSEAPRVPTPTREELAERRALDAQVAAAEKAIANRPEEFYRRQREWEKLVATGIEWHTLKPTQAIASSGTELEIDGGGAIHARGKTARTDTYTITLPRPAEVITALRIDTLPDSGQVKNFVINDILLSVDPSDPAPPPARYVRIELAGKKKILHLAEVEVYSGGKNVAPAGIAKQSSTDFGGPAALAIDGNQDGVFTHRSVTHTSVQDNPWWELDLKTARPIGRLAIHSRSDNGLFNRHDGFEILLLDQDHRPLWKRAIPRAKAHHELAVDGSRSVPLKNASTTFAQDRFPASAAIDGDADSHSGWAVGPQHGKSQSLAFEVDRSIGQAGGTLTLTLTQNYADHTLGHFQVRATASPDPRPLLPGEVSAALAVAPASRSAGQEKLISDHYAASDPWTMTKIKEITELRGKIAGLRPTTTPIMRDLPPEKHRKTHLMVKGNYLQPGEEVVAGVPAAFHPLKLEPGKRPDRLALAQWIIDPENPLTARVAANRFWAKLFGTGLVETEEDFGSQGTFPSHPELLDWLALHYRDDLRWDTKAFLKTIVMSSTYRQSNRFTAAHLASDPKNRLLARGPRFRLEAEMVRDQALVTSGLRSEKMFGPSVFPPQPAGLWRAAFNGERQWKTSEGDDRYRRGIYTFLRRSVPYPSMITFDAPNREICSVRRIRTNTPLQAFVTLNDPAYVEIAQALARRIIREGGSNTDSRIRHGLKLCLLRAPAPEQVAAIGKLYASELAHYQNAATGAKALATDPFGPLAKDFPASEAEAAAWTVVANVLLNLDAMMMK